MKTLVLLLSILLMFSGSALASGFGVFAQGASGQGQANAVVAHTSGPSSAYFNPALLHDVPGRQIEVGTTGVYAKRSVDFNSGASADADKKWEFPSTAYYTHEVNDRFSTGLALFFPFGLSTDWPDDYEGQYLGTYGEIITLNINPVMSYRVTDKLSLAGGFSLVYLDATLKKNLNQTAAYDITDSMYPGFLPPRGGDLPDVQQKFNGEGWGVGYNLGVLYKITDQLSFGATYRSEVAIDVFGRAKFNNVDPNLSLAIADTDGDAHVKLPAQATLAVAYAPTDKFVMEIGARWEDWDSTDELKVNLDNSVLGQSADVVPRDWKSTWAYNIGGQYRLSPAWAISAGYLYGENAVPSSTFEPLVPDSDAHLYSLGVEWQSTSWVVSGAFSYEHHEGRDKKNDLGDPLGSLLGPPVGTAKGTYESDIYLVGVSLGYRF